MTFRGLTVSWLAASSLLLGATTVAAQYTPPRLKSGEAPAPPPNAVGWAWEVADVKVDARGRPADWRGLYGTRGRAGFVWNAVLDGWSFEPARDESGPVESHVLVAACYRPAVLSNGPDSRAPGASRSPDVPSPTSMAPPMYPPRALGDGVVIVELAIDVSGAAKDARVVRSAGGFDGAALDAARQWRFQPARRAGVAVPAYAYLIFGFRQPVTEPVACSLTTCP